MRELQPKINGIVKDPASNGGVCYLTECDNNDNMRNMSTIASGGPSRGYTEDPRRISPGIQGSIERNSAYQTLQISVDKIRDARLRVEAEVGFLDGSGQTPESTKRMNASGLHGAILDVAEEANKLLESVGRLGRALNG